MYLQTHIICNHLLFIQIQLPICYMNMLYIPSFVYKNFTDNFIGSSNFLWLPISLLIFSSKMLTKALKMSIKQSCAPCLLSTQQLEKLKMSFINRHMTCTACFRHNYTHFQDIDPLNIRAGRRAPTIYNLFSLPFQPQRVLFNYSKIKCKYNTTEVYFKV